MSIQGDRKIPNELYEDYFKIYSFPLPFPVPSRLHRPESRTCMEKSVNVLLYFKNSRRVNRYPILDHAKTVQLQANELEEWGMRQMD